jgi:hypothetical protein
VARHCIWTNSNSYLTGAGFLYYDKNLHVSRETMKGVEFLIGRGIWYDEREIDIEELIKGEHFSG